MTEWDVVRARRDHLVPSSFPVVIAHTREAKRVKLPWVVVELAVVMHAVRRRRYGRPRGDERAVCECVVLQSFPSH